MSPKISTLKPTEVLKALLRADFYIHHQTGSHAQLRHKTKGHLRVTIPRHSGFDLPIFVVQSIIKQCEMTKEDFLKLLK